MIQYEFGKWGISFIFRITGSVFPVAFVFAFPCSALAFGLWWYFNNWAGSKPNIDDAKFLFSNYCFVLGFLLVFRTQIAYSRFWEGGSILQDMRSSWLNVTSSLVAFTTVDPAKREQVEQFLHLLIRLMSMMHCSALQEVVDMQDENFDIINCEGIDEESMKYLLSLDSGERVEVILQWIQRLIVNNQSSGVVSSPPPIVSRVFQELANGRMSFNAAKKIAQFPFPFPYAQMLMVMLMIHWVAAPFMAALLLEDLGTCVAATFVTSLAFWCINYIAAELEMPFGDNPNDLPVEELQVYFNNSLTMLMNPSVQAQPLFDYRRDRHATIEYKKMAVVEDFFLDRPSTKQPRKSTKPSTSLKTSGRLSSTQTLPPKREEEAAARQLPPRGSSTDAPAVQPTLSVSSAVSSAAPPAPPPANDTRLEPKSIQQGNQSKQSPATASDLQTGLASAQPRDGIPQAMLASLAIRSDTPSGAQESKRGAPLSAEEWQTFDNELSSLALHVEEKLSKMVCELVRLIVPAACGRLAEASCLAQGFTHPRKPWAPASDATLAHLIHNSSPDPELLQGVTLVQEASADPPERNVAKDSRPLTAM